MRAVAVFGLLSHAEVVVANGAGLDAGQRVLVTGHRGLVGRAVVEALEAANLVAVGLDLLDGDDLTDVDTVKERVSVHLAVRPFRAENGVVAVR